MVAGGAGRIGGGGRVIGLDEMTEVLRVANAEGQSELPERLAALGLDWEAVALVAGVTAERRLADDVPYRAAVQSAFTTGLELGVRVGRQHPLPAAEASA